MDLIDRQAAIDALKEHRALYCDNTPDTFSRLSYAQKSRVDELDTAIATLVNLPSARPKAKWIDGKRMGYDGTFHWFRQCSECLYEREDDTPEKDTNYCPNCGADMRGEQDDQ